MSAALQFCLPLYIFYSCFLLNEVSPPSCICTCEPGLAHLQRNRQFDGKWGKHSWKLCNWGWSKESVVRNVMTVNGWSDLFNFLCVFWEPGERQLDFHISWPGTWIHFSGTFPAFDMQNTKFLSVRAGPRLSICHVLTALSTARCYISLLVFGSWAPHRQPLSSRCASTPKAWAATTVKQF